MMFHPDCDEADVVAADKRQAIEQAGARARCEHSNYHDELACQMPGPLQRILIPEGHSRRSRYRMTDAYLRDEKAAREVDFEEIEADMYRGTDALGVHVPLDLLYMCR